MSAHENAWRAAQTQRCWLRTARLVSLLHYMLDSIYNCLQNGRCQSPGCKNLHRRDSTAKKMEEETEDAATTYHKRLDTELTRNKK